MIINLAIYAPTDTFSSYHCFCCHSLQILSLIVLLLSRCGGSSRSSPFLPSAPLDNMDSSIPWGDNPDTFILGSVTAYGYFIVLVGQTLGYLWGERSMMQVKIRA